MGLGGISLWQLLIILLIVVMIFGTKRLRSIGSDMGGAVKGFRKAMDEGEAEQERRQIPDDKSAADAEFKETSDTESKSGHQA
ncbi:MAG: Sec-independent protein translocase subunit TatA [Gammaproteobacteria bacterium]